MFHRLFRPTFEAVPQIVPHCSVNSTKSCSFRAIRRP
jgi:hypothetical protein